MSTKEPKETQILEWQKSSSFYMHKLMPNVYITTFSQNDGVVNNVNKGKHGSVLP